MVTPEPLTEWESLVQESAAELSPAKLNESLDKRLSFVTTNLALVATVAAGFGLFADRSNALQTESDALERAFLLLLASVAISLLGSAPNWFNKVQVSDLASVENYFKSRYRWRAWCARIAIALFTLAVVLVGFALRDTLSRVPAPVLSLSYATGDKPTVTATIMASGIEPPTELMTTVHGCETSASPGCEDEATLLAADSTKVESTGEIEIKLAVTPVPPDLERFEVTVAVDGETYRRSLDIAG